MFRVVIWYHHSKGNAGSSLLRTNLENDEKHSVKQDSLQLTPPLEHRSVTEQGGMRRCYLHLIPSKEGSAFHLCEFWGIWKYPEVLQIKSWHFQSSHMGYHHNKGTQAAVCSERTWRMMTSILSTRQLATDSASGTLIRNGTTRVCEGVHYISIPAKKGQHSLFASFRGYQSIQRNFRRSGDIKMFRIVICF